MVFALIVEAFLAAIGAYFVVILAVWKYRECKISCGKAWTSVGDTRIRAEHAVFEGSSTKCSLVYFQCCLRGHAYIICSVTAPTQHEVGATIARWAADDRVDVTVADAECIMDEIERQLAGGLLDE